MATDTTLFVRMIITNWETQNSRVTQILNTISDEQLLSPVAPERNRGVYIIGHLIAVSDAMFPLLGWGERLYPQLEKIFVSDPDQPGAKIPSIVELKEYWKVVNKKIQEHTSQMQPEEWFSRHTAVSEEDFAKEPHRNKLNIIVSRTNHLSYHFGQLVFLVKRKA